MNDVVSNEQNDRHYHGFEVWVRPDENTEWYGTVELGREGEHAITIYEGPSRECEHLAAMLVNVQDSAIFAMRNGIDFGHIVQSFRKAAYLER